MFGAIVPLPGFGVFYTVVGLTLSQTLYSTATGDLVVVKDTPGW